MAMNRELKRKAAQERYWRRRISQEQQVQEQVLVAKQQLKFSGKVYDVGAILPAADLPLRILDALLSSRRAWWRPRSSDFHPAPRDLPKPAAPAPRHPAVSIVWDKDPVESWRLTKQAMCRLTDGNSALALDLLLANVDARDLYRRATQAACAAEAKRRGTWSVCPSDLPVPL